MHMMVDGAGLCMRLVCVWGRFAYEAGLCMGEVPIWGGSGMGEVPVWGRLGYRRRFRYWIG